MTKLIVAFRNFANAPKITSLWSSQYPSHYTDGAVLLLVLLLGPGFTLVFILFLCLLLPL